MRQREPPDIVFYPVPDPDSASRSGEIDRIYARSIRRRLDESGMTPRQKAAAVDALIGRLKAQAEPEEATGGRTGAATAP